MSVQLIRTHFLWEKQDDVDKGSTATVEMKHLKAANFLNSVQDSLKQ